MESSDEDGPLLSYIVATPPHTTTGSTDGGKKTKAALEVWNGYRGAPDRLLEGLYQYYRGGGYQTLQLQRLSNHLILLFMMMSVLWLAYGVPWTAILVQSSSHLDDDDNGGVCTSIGCVAKRMTMFGWSFFVTVAGVWAWAAAQFWWVERPRWREAQLVMRHVLSIRDRQLVNIDFDVVLERLLSAQPSLLADNTKTNSLTKEMIVARMMRRENYMIALFNAKVNNDRVDGKESRLLDFKVPLSKPLEWALSFVVIGFVFDTASLTVHPRFLSRHPHDRLKLVEEFKRRSIMTGTVLLLATPLIFTLTLSYVLFRYGEEVYRDTRTISQRQYSHRARWLFRDYNELPHYFERRLAASQQDADLLMDQFHDLKVAAVCRVVGFMAGTVLIMQLLLLLLLPVADRADKEHRLWWIGLFGAIVAVCRGQQGQSRQRVDDPLAVVEKLRDTLHYHGGDDDTTGARHFHRLLSQWYPLKAKVVWSDLMGTIMTPLVLLLCLPDKADSLIDHFREHTVYVEGVGWVCSQSCAFTDGTAAHEKYECDDEKLKASVVSFAERHHHQKYSSSGGESEQEVDRVERERASLFYKHHV